MEGHVLELGALGLIKELYVLPFIELHLGRLDIYLSWVGLCLNWLDLVPIWIELACF